MDPQLRRQIAPSSLTSWTGTPTLMGSAHQHDDLEVNLVAEGGSMLYLFGGSHLEVAPGSTAAFWAAVHHQLIASSATRAHWVYVPFSTFLGWGLPEDVVSRILSGTPLVSPPSTRLASDEAGFEHWAADLATDDPERRRIAMLEVEARIRRLALREHQRDAGHFAGGDPAVRLVLAKVRHIAEHFREPVTVSEVADAAQLHPNYAMTQFRKVVRMTIGEYLAQFRLAEARRLLVTTDLRTNEVAAAAGFGSVSRLYAAFTAACGTPPGAFRREHGRAAHAAPGRTSRTPDPLPQQPDARVRR